MGWRATSAIEIWAPAKLNLFLEVLGKRADGFHELETLLVPINLFDTLRFTPTQSNDLHLDCEWAQGLLAKPAATAIWGDLPPSRSNLVVRALELLRQRASVSDGAQIQLIKRIPAAAGLGGASSDAAAALRAGNIAWQIGWSEAQLADLSAELGSDIPFFFAGGAALCRGRGEQVENVEAGGVMHVVVVRPPIGLATAEVYRGVRLGHQPHSSIDLCEGYRQGNAKRVARALVNRLQSAAEELTPWVRKLASAFRDCGVEGHQLTGSGSCYFGVCSGARHARQVAARIRARDFGPVWALSTLPRTEASRGTGIQEGVGSWKSPRCASS